MTENLISSGLYLCWTLNPYCLGKGVSFSGTLFPSKACPGILNISSTPSLLVLPVCGGDVEEGLSVYAAGIDGWHGGYKFGPNRSVEKLDEMAGQ